jgi:hypothetical protein
LGVRGVGEHIASTGVDGGDVLASDTRLQGEGVARDDGAGAVELEDAELLPHRKISYTWVVGDMALDTVVTFTLTPTASGTRLSLVQFQLIERPCMRIAVSGTHRAGKSTLDDDHRDVLFDRAYAKPSGSSTGSGKPLTGAPRLNARPVEKLDFLVILVISKPPPSHWSAR